MPEQVVIEGTWEEISAHADELAGRRVRLTILDAEAPAQVTAATAESGESGYRANPVFETEEILAPFDFPRSPGRPVEALKGDIRLPDVPAEWRQED